jgi:hypothetical protein
MDTNKPNAAAAATAAEGKYFWRGRRFSLSQRERAGVRENAT